MDPALQSVLSLSSVLNRIDSASGKGIAAMALSAAPAVRASAAAAATKTATTTTAEVTTAVKPSEKTTSVAVSEGERETKREADEDEDEEKDKETAQSSPAASSSSSSSSSSAAATAGGAVSIWYEFVDPSLGKSYYHDYATQQTTWDAPPAFVPHTHTAAPLQALQTQPVQYEDYRAKAYFSSNNGRYTGGSTYWERTGRPEDKAGRQLATFIDLQELERNRAETHAKREEFQRAMQGANWKEIKAEQKEKKKRKRDKWLLED